MSCRARKEAGAGLRRMQLHGVAGRTRLRGDNLGIALHDRTRMHPSWGAGVQGANPTLIPRKITSSAWSRLTVRHRKITSQLKLCSFSRRSSSFSVVTRSDLEHPMLAADSKLELGWRVAGASAAGCQTATRYARNEHEKSGRLVVPEQN